MIQWEKGEKSSLFSKVEKNRVIFQKGQVVVSKDTSERTPGGRRGKSRLSKSGGKEKGPFNLIQKVQNLHHRQGRYPAVEQGGLRKGGPASQRSLNEDGESVQQAT